MIRRRSSRPCPLARAVSLIGLATALLVATPASAQNPPRVALAHQLAEVDLALSAGRPADALVLLDEIVTRAQAGEILPSGVALPRLLLTAAHAHFQTQSYPRAAELAAAVERQPSVGLEQRGEARLVHGLALALDQKYLAAIPVFTAAEESATHRDKALLYGALAAREAGRLPHAIANYQRLLASAPRDRDWADSALALIDLHLRAGDLTAARRGLVLLRGQLAFVDNLAGLNLLCLQLGDALLQADDPAGALTVFRYVSARDDLVAEQNQRLATLERAVGRLRALTRPTAIDIDLLRRLDSRLTQARAALAEVEKIPAFDATLRQRLAHAFQARGGAWEAALLLEDLLERHPDFPERESAWFGLVRAYADAGRFEKVIATVERFLAETPDSPLGPRALYLAAESAGARGDLNGQLAFLDLAESRFGPNPLTEPIRLLRANALFALTRFAEAGEVIRSYEREFPNGKFTEEARYLAAMAELAEGRSTAAEKLVRAHLKDFPRGRFVADARYRLAAIAYSREDYAGCAALCVAWLADHPADQPQRGEVLSLYGDALAGQGDIAAAIVAYRAALALTLSDEQLGYVLDELTRHYQARREFDAAVAMWETFAAERPDHPFVINAAYWISRIRTREGRIDEALELVARIARRHLHDPAQTDVERLLVELAATLARTPRARPGEAKPAPTPITELFARADALLLDLDTRDQPTAQARARFVHAEIAAARQDTAGRDERLAAIATTHPPEDLPPGILGKVGDTLLAQNQPELARPFFERIVSVYPRSVFADFGHAGLGEIALRADQPEVALAHFDAAIDVAGARFKLKEATLGRARAHLALRQPERARELFEQVASTRAWRGEATAEALFQLGEIAADRATPDDLAKAQAHYQRVYLSYKRHETWVARAYLRSAEVFVLLGQRQEAIDTLNRMLSFEPLRTRPEAETARARLRQL